MRLATDTAAFSGLMYGIDVMVDGGDWTEEDLMKGFMMALTYRAV